MSNGTGAFWMLILVLLGLNVKRKREIILYATDPFQNQTDIDALRDALRNSKGPGNFRNLFLYAPGGKKDGLQLIPIAEVAAKDEFLAMKSISRDDVLAAHRVPPQLLGIIPNNAGGFGSIDQAAAVFDAQEITPLCATFSDINTRTGTEIVRFADYPFVPA